MRVRDAAAIGGAWGLAAGIVLGSLLCVSGCGDAPDCRSTGCPAGQTCIKTEYPAGLPGAGGIVGTSHACRPAPQKLTTEGCPGGSCDEMSGE